MEYKELGKTKEKIPAIGMGTWQMRSGKADFEQGIFTSKNGYQSKWWRPEERESIRKILGGESSIEYEDVNFYILHLSYA